MLSSIYLEHQWKMENLIRVSLKGAFSTIEKILRSQYALGYSPPDLEANGSFRSVEVTSNRRGLQVHTRNGYYAPHK